MNKLMQQLAVAGACLLSAGVALAGTARVTYQHPERFADMPFSQWEREEVLHSLTDHFDRLARHLPPDQQLQVEVLDLDMAGRLVPTMRAMRDVRLMHGGADWPRMDMRYAVVQGDQVLKSGQVKLADMAYLHRLSRYADGEHLRYERRMIDDWFYKEITPRRRDR